MAKIRVQFVANSSSSSYVCAICGETGEGRDASPSDFDMTYCVNSHVICNEHKLTDDEENEDCEIPETSCPICMMEVYDPSELSKYLIKVYGVPWDEVFAIIKEGNKRRRKLYDFEYINEVFRRFDLNQDKIMVELKGKFKSYQEYYNYINNRDY